MGEHKVKSSDAEKRRRKIDSEVRKDKDRDILAKDEPFVLESSASDPIFPAMQEFEVDADGPAGSTRKHPGLLWFAIAVVAFIVLVVALVVAGDWI